jgi:ferritin
VNAHQRVKYCETIADNLSKAGFSWACVSAIDSNGRAIWIADAHRDDGKHAMLLNEFLKEHSTVEELKKQGAALTAGLQKVGAALEASKPAPQMVENNC